MGVNMNLSSKLATTGAAVGMVVTALFGAGAFSNIFNRFAHKGCDEQLLEKTQEAHLPTTGALRFNQSTGQCVYKYKDSNGEAQELAWKPQ